MTTAIIKDEATSKSLTPAFGYLRVSGNGQLDGDGETRQRETISTFASRKGFRVIRWFFDGAVSGEVDAVERPEFGEMLLMAGEATSRVILVERADRLARTLMVCEFACAEARKQEVQIIDCSSDTDLTNSDDPTRVLIRQVMGAVAEFNKNVMVKRLAAARNRKRESGRRCEGRKPYGNQNDEQLFIVTQILKYRDEERLSWNQIARKLKTNQFKSPDGTFYWSRYTVRDIYERETELKLAKARHGRTFAKVSLDGLGV